MKAEVSSVSPYSLNFQEEPEEAPKSIGDEVPVVEAKESSRTVQEAAQMPEDVNLPAASPKTNQSARGTKGKPRFDFI